MSRTSPPDPPTGVPPPRKNKGKRASVTRPMEVDLPETKHAKPLSKASAYQQLPDGVQQERGSQLPGRGSGPGNQYASWTGKAGSTSETDGPRDSIDDAFADVEMEARTSTFPGTAPAPVAIVPVPVKANVVTRSAPSQFFDVEPTVAQQSSADDLDALLMDMEAVTAVQIVGQPDRSSVDSLMAGLDKANARAADSNSGARASPASAAVSALDALLDDL